MFILQPVVQGSIVYLNDEEGKLEEFFLFANACTSVYNQCHKAFTNGNYDMHIVMINDGSEDECPIIELTISADPEDNCFYQKVLRAPRERSTDKCTIY